MLLVERDKTAVQSQTFLLHDAHDDLDSGLSHALNATSLHLCKGVNTATDASLDALTDNQICTRWRLSIVGTRF